MKRHLAALLLLLLPLLGGCGSTYDEVLYFDEYYEETFIDLIANDDRYTAQQNQVLVVSAANGVLVNDLFYDAYLTFPTVSDRGGQVDGRADGSFRYTPPQDFVGTDRFRYTLEDEFGLVSAQVTIFVEGSPSQPTVVEVDAVGGNDSAGPPFRTIQAAVETAGPGSTIVVTPRPGRVYQGEIALLDGQRLIGAGYEQPLEQEQSRPVLSGPVLLASGNEVRGLTIEGSPGDAIDGQGQVGGSITDCELFDSALSGIYLAPIGGDWEIARNTIRGTGGNEPGILVASVGSDSVRLLVENNFVKQCEDAALTLHAVDSSTLRAFIFGNRFSDCLPDYTFEALADDNARTLLVIDGNVNDDVYRLERLSNDSQLGVERLTEVETDNSGTLLIPAGTLPIDDLPVGTVFP